MERYQKTMREQREKKTEEQKKGQQENRKSVRCAATGLLLLTTAGLLQLCARYAQSFADWYAHRIYPVLVKGIGGFSGFLPFSVVEIGLYALAAGSLWYLVKHISKPGRIACRGIFLSGILLFSYMTCCESIITLGRFPNMQG